MGQTANSVETDLGAQEGIELDIGTDENCDDDFASQVIDAYLAEVNIIPPTKAWYLDSRAFNHVSRDPIVFSSLNPSSGTRITSVGGDNHAVTSMGNFAIRLPIVGIQQISHVFYSPGITKNLISIGFLPDRGFALEFLKDQCI